MQRLSPHVSGKLDLYNVKIRRHSLASHFLMRNNFENVKYIKFYINSRNERFDAIKTSLIFINNKF